MQLLLAHIRRTGTVESLPQMDLIDEIRDFMSWQVASDLFFRAINAYETLDRTFEHCHLFPTNFDIEGDAFIGVITQDNIVIAEVDANRLNGACIDKKLIKFVKRVKGVKAKVELCAKLVVELDSKYLVDDSMSDMDIMLMINEYWNGKFSRVFKNEKLFYTTNEEANALICDELLFGGCKVSKNGQFEAINTAKSKILKRMK